MEMAAIEHIPPTSRQPAVAAAVPKHHAASDAVVIATRRIATAITRITEQINNIDVKAPDDAGLPRR